MIGVSRGFRSTKSCSTLNRPTPNARQKTNSNETVTRIVMVGSVTAAPLRVSLIILKGQLAFV